MYASQHFPFGAAFVCQAGNFWTLLQMYDMKQFEDRQQLGQVKE